MGRQNEVIDPTGDITQTDYNVLEKANEIFAGSHIRFGIQGPVQQNTALDNATMFGSVNGVPNNSANVYSSALCGWAAAQKGIVIVFAADVIGSGHGVTYKRNVVFVQATGDNLLLPHQLGHVVGLNYNSTPFSLMTAGYIMGNFQGSYIDGGESLQARMFVIDNNLNAQ